MKYKSTCNSNTLRLCSMQDDLSWFMAAHGFYRLNRLSALTFLWHTICTAAWPTLVSGEITNFYQVNPDDVASHMVYRYSMYVDFMSMAKSEVSQSPLPCPTFKYKNLIWFTNFSRFAPICGKHRVFQCNASCRKIISYDITVLLWYHTELFTCR